MNILPSKLVSLFIHDSRNRVIYSYIISSIIIYLFCFITANDSSFSFCLAKNYLGIDCPGCGVTRGINSLFQMNLKEAFYYNPGSVVICLSMLVMTMLCLLAIALPNVKEEIILRFSIWINKLITASLLVSYFLTT